MKYLKLASIFSILLVVVIAALYFSNQSADDSAWDDDNGSSDYLYCKSIVDKSWKKKKQWDKNTYDQNIKDIESVCARSSELDGEDKQKLLNYNSACAFEFVNKPIFSEWKKTNCNDGIINKLYQAAVIIEKNKSYSCNMNEFVLIRNCYQYYYKAKNLSCVEITPLYDINSNTWSWEWEVNGKLYSNADYEEYEKEMREKGKNCVPDAYMKYIGNAVEKYLNEYELQVQKRSQYAYSKLADIIKEAFPIPTEKEIAKRKDFYEKQKEKLQQINLKFPDEYSDYLSDRTKIYEQLITHVEL